MIDIRPQSSSTNKRRPTEIVPSIHQLAHLTEKEPILGTEKNIENFISLFSTDHLKTNFFQL